MLTRKEKRERKHRNEWFGFNMKTGEWKTRRNRKWRKKMRLQMKPVLAMLESVFAD